MNNAPEIISKTNVTLEEDLEVGLEEGSVAAMAVGLEGEDLVVAMVVGLEVDCLQ